MMLINIYFTPGKNNLFTKAGTHEPATDRMWVITECQNKEGFPPKKWKF